MSTLVFDMKIISIIHLEFQFLFWILFSFWYWDPYLQCSAVSAWHCWSEDHCAGSGSGQLCTVEAAEAQLSSVQWQAAWRVLSLHFTAPCLALTHCAIQSPDPIFTLLWAPHHCESELIWKASRIFWCEQVSAICICSSLEDFTGQLRQADIEKCQKEFSSSSPSSSSYCLSLFHPTFNSILPIFSRILSWFDILGLGYLSVFCKK